MNLFRQARHFGAVSAAAVKQLRQLTGSPLKDCMKALE
jgi:elongation factor Ts